MPSFNHMVKIAFCGKMASGKTTMADELCKVLEKASKYSFATGVKDFGRFLFNIPEGVKDRAKFQKVGDGARKFIGEDVWVNALFTKVKNDESIRNHILDDCRYANEVKKLKEDGWYVILLDIDDDLQIERLKTTYPNDWQKHVDARNHPSELNVDMIEKSLFDLIINVANDGKALEDVSNFIIANQW